jgi:hypothetical protein
MEILPVPNSMTAWKSMIQLFMSTKVSPDRDITSSDYLSDMSWSTYTFLQATLGTNISIFGPMRLHLQSGS